MVSGINKGDIIWVNMSPTLGHEQSGRRPAIVLRANEVAHISNMVLVCPITNTNRRHPLHCPLDDRTKTRGYIMCDQVRSIDVTQREIEIIEAAPKDIVDECVDILISMLTGE